MRKSLLLLAGMLLLAGINCVHAQRGATKTITTTRAVGVRETFEHTESFKLEAGYEMLVTPLVADIEVISTDRKTFAGTLRQDKPNGLAGNEYMVSKLTDGKRIIDVDIELVRAQVIYDFCQETGADLIVAPQFNLRHKMRSETVTDENGIASQTEVPIERDGKYIMIVDMVGFPARYTNFRAGSRNDGWIKELFKEGRIGNTDREVVVTSETAVRK